ncbi:MAG: ABC transporter permease [Ilumatobacter sp.]|nr:ABC transporter permease [Ilumatobacter sp.]
MSVIDESGAAASHVSAGRTAEVAVVPPVGPPGEGLRRFVGPGVVFALFVGFWYFTHHVLMSDARKFLVPPPHHVMRDAFFTWDIPRGTGGSRTGGGLSRNLEGLWSSTQVAALGLAIAILIGLALATAMSQAKWVENAFYPFLVALQAMPILAFVPLIGALFGFDFWSRVLVCIMIALFPIVANTLFGLISVERGYHELMNLHGASRWTKLRKLQYPAAMPSIFTGLQISAGLSVVGAVVGDFFFRQGEPGIGRLINTYQNSNETEQMYGAVIMSALLGIAVFLGFGILGRRVVSHWHETRNA